MWRAYIIADGQTVQVDGGGPQSSTSGQTLEGWWSTPEGKWELTERASGDGAHDVPDSQVLYAARTVTLTMWAVGKRNEQIEQLKALLRTAHHQTRLRVVDDTSDTYIDGLATVTDTPASTLDTHQEVVLTLLCPRPERLSTQDSSITLMPFSGTMGGLRFGDDAEGLMFPIQFGAEAADVLNFGTLQNNGSSRAYPVITVNGIMDGVRLDFNDGETVSSLEWAGYIGAVPLILDCRTRRASIGGLDVSQYLTQRGFPVIQPGQSITASLQAAGSGWATITVHDTYI